MFAFDEKFKLLFELEVLIVCFVYFKPDSKVMPGYLADDTDSKV